MKFRNIIIFIVVPVIIAILSYFYASEIIGNKAISEKYFLLIFSFILISILLIYLLLVGIGIIIIDLKRKKSGAKYQAQLSILFLIVILINTIPILIITRSLINSSIEGWFKPSMENPVSDSINIISEIYSQYKSRTVRIVNNFSDVYKKKSTFIDDFCSASDLDFLLIYKNNILIRRYVKNSANVKKSVITEIGRLALDTTKERIDLRIIQGAEFTYGLTKPNINEVAIMGYFIPETIISRKESVTKSYKIFSQITLVKETIRSLFFIILFITLLVSFISLIISFLLARSISKPIRELIKGTKMIAAGDFSYKVEVKATSEMRDLIKSFNYMVRELDASRKMLEQFKIASAWKKFIIRMVSSIKRPIQEIETIIRNKDKDKTDRFKQIQSNVNEVNNVINDFQKNTHVASLEFVPEDINILIKDVFDKYDNIDMEFILCEELPLISINRKRFIDAMNILINTDREKGRKKQVSITTRKEKNIFGDFMYLEIDFMNNNKDVLENKDFLKIREDIEYNNAKIWMDEVNGESNKVIIELPI